MNEKTDKPADLTDRSYRAARRRTLAIVLPLIGIVLYTTPILRIFTQDVTVFGLPLIFIFVYGAWLSLILLGRSLAKRLQSEDGP